MPPLQRLPPTAVQAVGVAGVEALYGAYGVYALQGQSVGGDVGRDAVTLCDGDDLLYGVIDARDALGGPCLVVALELIGDVYEAASVYDVVRGVEDAPLRERFAVPGLEEDIVRATGDDGTTKVRQRDAVDDGAQSARGQDVAGEEEDLIRLHRLRSERFDHDIDRPSVDVCHDQIGPFSVVEQLTEVATNVPEALHGDRPSSQGWRAEDLLRAGPHTFHDA